MHAASSIVVFFSILFPTKAWFSPNHPLTVDIRPQGDVTLVLTDFAGKAIESQAGAAEISGEKTVDLKQVFPPSTAPGTYVLYAVPKGKQLPEFVGTPLVVSVREDKRRGAPTGTMVTKVEPLRYAVINTEHGPLTCVFYYDVAPHTSDNFLTLAEGGYFDGLTFHRIVPGFVIQGGDPRGDGTGGPGYQIDAEFSDRQHLEGVLSMARGGDPNEMSGMMPRPEFANSAGSQFFVCLDYANTQQLDRKYTAFGKVVDGMDAVKKIAATPIADPRNGKPQTPQVIKSVEVKAVTARENPYTKLAPQVARPESSSNGAVMPKDD
ncbi:MAG: peptidylprolyl isomerase [Tepidisphaeraceae bacterium]